MSGGSFFYYEFLITIFGCLPELWDSWPSDPDKRSGLGVQGWRT